MTATAATPDQLWYTRCPVPTASGLAHHLGWLAEEFAADGLHIGVLQDAPPEIARHHFDHQLVGLFREGGNVPALVARSEGAPSRLIGLTWIEEWQSILVRADSPIRDAAGLVGARVAVPAWAATKAQSFPRAMALHGYAGALRSVGRGLDDVVAVEVDSRLDPSVGRDSGDGWWPGLRELAAGEVDAVYVKGARSAEQAARVGAVVGVDLDAFEDRSLRVNNGTPRPITVHEDLLRDRPDLVTRFLVRSLRATQWAAANLDAVREVVGRETRSGVEGVVRAYGDRFHLSLAPELSAERLGLLERQKSFLADHGFLAADVDLAAWTAAEPLAEAQRIVGLDSAVTTEVVA